MKVYNFHIGKHIGIPSPTPNVCPSEVGVAQGPAVGTSVETVNQIQSVPGPWAFQQPCKWGFVLTWIELFPLIKTFT